MGQAAEQLEIDVGESSPCQESRSGSPAACRRNMAAVPTKPTAIVRYLIRLSARPSENFGAHAASRPRIRINCTIPETTPRIKKAKRKKVVENR